MPSTVRLLVNGRGFIGWKSVGISQSIESISGAFGLDVTDRWAGQNQPWPIAEEDECTLEVNGEKVIDGYVDKRAYSIRGAERNLTVSGRDKCAVLVDSSALLSRWQFQNVDALAVTKAICEPFGIKVSLRPGIVLPTVKAKIAISPGEGAFDAIAKVCGAAGVLVVSDGAGGIMLTRAGALRAEALVLGENVLEASVEYDGAERFAKYVVVTQIPGTDKASGKATRVRADAVDLGVRRKDRVLVVQPEAGISAAFARRRADWEARLRAAKAESVSVTVKGWHMPTSGILWPVNAICPVKIPAIGVNGDMLIVSKEMQLNDAGESTTLKLMRPDAFEPEPKAVVGKGGTAWKELAGGAR